MRLAVIGGGIAGLAAAWEGSDQAEVTVFEPGRLGGKILTEPFDGRPVDCGPDAFIIRTPDAVELCAELGVGDLVAPQAGRTLLWWRGRLRELPEGLVLGAPRRIAPLVTSGLLSPAGVLRAAGDLVLPRRTLEDDVSVRDLIAGRFGPQVADRLVDPLVGGIHAGRTDRLSAAATVPQLLEAARRSRSLLAALRRLPGGPGGAAPFLTPRAGLGALVERLATALRDRGVTVVPRGVDALVADGARWAVEPEGKLFDAVVLAVPAPAATRILGSEAPAGLTAIPAASVALVLLAYDGLDVPPAANGILVPRSEGRLMTACSFGSAKWPHWAAPGRTLLRVSAGRDGDRRAFDLDDEQLAGRLAAEVAEALGRPDVPDRWRVHRWPDAFPQYRIGHLDAVAAMSAALARTHPGVGLCGASYHGAGLPACIASGRRAARAVLVATSRPV